MIKCCICNKKILVHHDCVCGNQYCLKHRYPESHGCTYDYKTEEKERLTRIMVKVAHDKIPNRITG